MAPWLVGTPWRWRPFLKRWAAWSFTSLSYTIKKRISPRLQGSVGDGPPHAIHTRSLWQHLAFVHLKRQSRFDHTPQRVTWNNRHTKSIIWTERVARSRVHCYYSLTYKSHWGCKLFKANISGVIEKKTYLRILCNDASRSNEQTIFHLQQKT